MYQKHVSNLKELKTHDYKQTIRPHDTFLCIKPHASLSTCVAGRADGYLLTARSLPIWKDVITQMRSLDGRLIAIALFALKLRRVHFGVFPLSETKSFLLLQEVGKYLWRHARQFCALRFSSLVIAESKRTLHYPLDHSMRLINHSCMITNSMHTKHKDVFHAFIAPGQNVRCH